MQNLLSKKYIIPALGLVFIVQALWAFKILGLDIKNINLPGQKPAALQTKDQTASLALTASKSQLKVGEEVVVTINLVSEKYTDGADVIILYDPKILSPAKSVILGTVYSEYPLNKVDTQLGRIAVSGISSNPKGVLAKGVLGTITFTAKAAGNTEITFDYTPGSTIDSNVIENKTAKDLLDQVSNLKVNIVP